MKRGDEWHWRFATERIVALMVSDMIKLGVQGAITWKELKMLEIWKMADKREGTSISFPQTKFSFIFIFKFWEIKLMVLPFYCILYVNGFRLRMIYILGEWRNLRKSILGLKNINQSFFSCILPWTTTKIHGMPKDYFPSKF